MQFYEQGLLVEVRHASERVVQEGIDPLSGAPLRIFNLEGGPVVYNVLQHFVPEPGSDVLSGFGIALLAWMRRSGRASSPQVRRTEPTSSRGA
jgi:hypothetical protein